MIFFQVQTTDETDSTITRIHNLPSRLDSTELRIVDFTEEIPDLRSDILNAILDLSAELESR